MKKLLCKLANWILRKCTNPIMELSDDVYINGRTYKLLTATAEISPNACTVINFEVLNSKRG